MKFTLVRFDNIIDDENGEVIEAYRGYNFLFENFVARKYDDENRVFIAVDVSGDEFNRKFDEIEIYFWSLGYDEVVFLSALGGYSDLKEIRKKSTIQRDCYGNYCRIGNTCPGCGIRLYKAETNWCDKCGWKRNIENG